MDICKHSAEVMIHTDVHYVNKTELNMLARATLFTHVVVNLKGLNLKWQDSEQGNCRGKCMYFLFFLKRGGNERGTKFVLLGSPKLTEWYLSMVLF